MTPRPARMSRDDRRAQLLDLAEELFASEGFHHVSMDDIAERADVSKPVLYRHLPSKLDLYLAVVDRLGQSLIDGVTEALAAPAAPAPADAPPPVVRAVLDAFAAFVDLTGPRASLLFESDVTHDAAVRARVERSLREVAALLQTRLRSDLGLGADVSPLLADTLVAVARTTAMAAREPMGRADSAVDAVAALVWHGLSGFAHRAVTGPAAAPPST